MTDPAVSIYLPVEKQAILAQHIVKQAAAAEQEVSGRYLKDHVVAGVLDVKSISKALTIQDLANLEKQDWEKKAHRLQEDIGTESPCSGRRQKLADHCRDVRKA